MHVVLHDGHKAVGDDGDINLRFHSILGSAPELLDSEVLLEPLEEQLYQPSVLVEVCNLLSRQVHRIGQEHELTVLLFVIVSDETECFGIVPVTVIDRQLYLRISSYVLRHSPFPPDTSVLQVGLGSDNEEGLQPLYAVEFLEVVVCPVKDVVSICLIGYFLHGP